jgi:hypothetical protein
MVWLPFHFLTGLVGHLEMTDLVVAAQAGDPETSISGFAALLVGFERSLSADRPTRVLLADDSDQALAAALVASKLLIPLQATADASRAASTNGRLIAQLVATYTPGA